MKPMRCLVVLILLFACMSFVSMAWSQEKSIPIIGGQGLIFQNGIITRIDGNKIIIKDAISRVFITTEIDRRRIIDQKIIADFEVGSQVRIGDGKIFLTPTIKPIQQKKIIQKPIQKAPITK